MSMREHFFLISVVHTFSCGFVRHFICINSCLLTSFLQQQIVPCKKAAIRDPALILQSTPSTSLCSWLFKLKKKIIKKNRLPKKKNQIKKNPKHYIIFQFCYNLYCKIEVSVCNSSRYFEAKHQYILNFWPRQNITIMTVIGKLE